MVVGRKFISFCFALFAGSIVFLPSASYAQIVEIPDGVELPHEDAIDDDYDPSAAAFELFKPRERIVRAFNEIENREIELIFGGASHSSKNGLEIYVFRIGQADSMLVVGPGDDPKTMLVDLGVPHHGRYSGDYSAKHVGQRITDIVGKTEIDYFIVSHFHSDHVGNSNSGIMGLLNRSNPTFRIDTLIDTGDKGAQYIDRSSRYKTINKFEKQLPRWLREGKIGRRIAASHGTSQIYLGPHVTVDFVAVAGRVHATDKGVHDAYENSRPENRNHYQSNKTSENDLSIAMEISLGDFEFWSAGDLSGADKDGKASLSGYNKGYTNVEWPLVQYWQNMNQDTDVEIYRASHHGSRYSSSKPLLEALDPEYVLYSADEGHSHPTPSLVKRTSKTAKQLATEIDHGKWGNTRKFEEYGGSVVGEIQIFVSKSGDEYTINGEKHVSYSDVDERLNKDVGEENRIHPE